MTRSHHPTRRAALGAAAAMAALAWTPLAQAQAPAYPSKPITIVVAYPAGGVADQMARVLAGELSKRVGQSVTVENRVGASGMIGANFVAKAAPDGHTLLLGAMAETVFTPHMNDKMAYQPDKDLAPVAMAARYPFMLVANPAFPARTTRDLIALARKNPGQHTYATAGNGSVQHLAMEMFTRAAGIQLRHIPYKGVTPALADVLGNQVSMMFAGFPPAMVQVQAGTLNAIAMSTRERLKAAPDVPAVAETPGMERYDFPVWVGLFAPAATPPAVLDRLNRESAAVFAMPAIRAGIEKGGMTISDESRAAFTAFVKGEYGKYQKIIKDAGIKED
jgi:tripartite-type tricarboxylate transporter receptor subunit TctC